MIRLFGHPVHPLLVHFPLACWTLATACDLAGRWEIGEWIAPMGPVLTVLGSLLAVPAMLTGLLELATLADRAEVLKTVYLHLGWTSAAWLLYGGSLLARWDAGTLQSPASDGALALSVLGLLALLVGGWHGAELVYSYGVGTKNRSDDPGV